MLIPSTEDIAKRTRLGVSEVERITQLISQEILEPPRSVFEERSLGSQKFTTGDADLDHLLGGGIRTGVIWEVAGEG